MICPFCGRPTLLDSYGGEGGAGEGYWRAGFCVTAVDNSRARLARYPHRCEGALRVRSDAVRYILRHGHEYTAHHASPPCTGYTRGTIAVPNRVAKYDRLIGATREALVMTGRPYIIENVMGARSELINPVMLCGRQFNLTATDTDGTPLVMDRHRLFESNVPLMVPEHLTHDMTLQVAGSYGGGRRDKVEAREIRKGGYVPKSADVQRALLGVPWMSEVGVRLSIPPVYTEFLGEQMLTYITRLEATA